MHLIDCEINLILTCSANCVIAEVKRTTNLAIADTKFYVLVLSLCSSFIDSRQCKYDKVLNDNKYQ